MSTSFRRRTTRAIPTWPARAAATKSSATSRSTSVWPIRPNPGTNRAYQTGIDRPDGTLAKFTSVCAPVIYRGDRLPAELNGNAFVAEPAANVVSRIVLTMDGATMRARKAYERGEFIASTDERFRPVSLSNAPDGTLYVVDMYRGVIQQRADVTQYLRDHIVKHGLERPTGLGRIYRVVHETTHARYHAGRVPDVGGLVAALSHPNGWRRDTAQQLLVERGDPAVVPDLTRLAASAPDWRTRLHALWTLDGMDVVQPATIVECARRCVGRCARGGGAISERWLGDPASDPAAVLKKISDPDWAVRRQLAASLGALPPGAREAAVASLLEKGGGGPRAARRGAQWDSRPGASGARAACRCRCSRDVRARRGAHHADGDYRARRTGCGGAAGPRGVSDEARPAAVRGAIMRGAEVALLGVPAPESGWPSWRSASSHRSPVPDLSRRACGSRRCVCVSKNAGNRAGRGRRAP